MRLEASAERKLASRSRKELSQKVTRLPSVQLPDLGIRMVPNKTLVVKEQEQSPILSKNPREEVLVRLVSTSSPSLMFSP